MRKELRNSQLNTIETYLLYKDECEMTASNVFRIKRKDGKKLLIDIDNVNETLLYNGSIAWFVDKALGLIALPYTNVGALDINKKPTVIDVVGGGNYHARLHKGEFVIMYDNSKKISILRYVRQYAERLTHATRTIDVNIAQQKTPRIWKTTDEKQQTLEDLLKNYNENVDNVLAFDDLDLNDCECIVAPAPFVADKVNDSKEKIWNEFLRFIGVTNLNIQKKERNIKDEVIASQGGTVASRFSRFSPRKDAIEEIKEKFGIDLIVEYYDGEPTTDESEEKNNEENEVDLNV